MKAPQRFAKIIDAVSESDRLYLVKHPSEKAYYREYVPGELWPVFLPQDTMVQVVFVSPRVRLRMPYFVVAVQGESS